MKSEFQKQIEAQQDFLDKLYSKYYQYFIEDNEKVIGLKTWKSN